MATFILASDAPCALDPPLTARPRAARARADRARRRTPSRPTPNLKVEGIPPIPAALAAKVAPYTEFRPRSLASWHPVKHELIVATRATNTAQLFDVRAPLGAPVQLTDYAEPVRFGAWWPAKPDMLVFARDTGGNEQAQLYRLDPGAKEPVLLTDANRAAPGAGGQPRARPAADRLDRRRQDRRAAREPDARRRARSIRSTRPRREGHDAARHRLGRLQLLVRRQAARDERVQVGQRDLRVGDGRRDRRAQARVPRAPATTRSDRLERGRRSRATARACS